MSEFIEGVSRVRDAERIEAHLADCRDCRDLLAVIASSSNEAARDARVDESEARRGASTEKAASRASFLEAGTQIGRFVIGEPLGRGGMGVVYRARDPELDRAVAIKLLRFDYAGDRAAEAEARLIREARAMARLSHPNVVTVYEVGSDRGYVFIAMELHIGATLEDWLEIAPRRPREIIDTFISAGRGLQAAHEAGLVHRDFKPANVMVDGNGEAVVLDFGLVTADDQAMVAELGADGPEPASGSGSGSALTVTGTLLGTPAYMAPEQHGGEAVGPLADQWAFAVCLYQALTDAHPFAAKDATSLRKKVLAGKPPPPPKGVTARVRRAIMRGLARQPEARHESMAAMMTAIGGRRRPTLVWTALAVVLAALALLAFLSQRRDSELCSGGASRSAAIWGQASKDELRASFAALDLPFAEASALEVERELNRYFNRWEILYRETCRAGRISHELSEEAMERSVGCLDRRLREAAALTTLFRRADRSVVAGAQEATARLADLESCQDQQRLALIAPPPQEPEALAALDELRESTAAVKALIDVGRPSAGLEKARALLAPGQALGYPVALAEVKYWLGRALEASGLYAEADEVLRESAYAALGAADDRQVILSATALVRVVGFRKADVTRGEEWHQIARATLRRQGPSVGLNRDLDAAQARLLSALGTFDEAERMARKVLAEVIDERGPTDLGVAEAHSAVGSYCVSQYRYECAEENFRAALAIFTDHYGSEHPALAGALTDLGTAAAAQGKFEDALVHHRRAIGIREAGLDANHPELGRSYHEISYPLIATGALDEAMAACKRALAIKRASLGPDHPSNAATLYHLGYLYWTQKHYELAYESHKRALEIRSAAFGSEHAYIADIEIELGRTRRDQLRRGEAATHYEKALAIRRKKLGSESAATIYTLTDLASMYVLLGDYERGLPLLEEADRYWKKTDEGDALMQAMNHFFLAQAMWAQGRSRADARHHARLGQAGYKEAGDEEAAGRAQRWLASH